MTDKRNHVDYHWYLVRTQPGHERELGCLIDREKENTHNILEAYCPTHTTVNVRHGDQERKLPLFDGYVFVLATESALREFLQDRYPNAFLRYKRKRQENEKAEPFTIPEEQMRAFMDFNDNYADKVVVLERPYTDYAFNPNEDNQPNEIVRVLDGPLAGREGYICRFRRKKGLVFQVQGIEPGSHLTVSYPNVYDLHVVRLHNAEGDRLSLGTEKARAADLLWGILQATEPEERVFPLFHSLMERLRDQASFRHLCQDLAKQGHEALARRLSTLDPGEARQLLTLARYERDCPGYLRQAYPALVLRPFLTPTSGLERLAGGEPSGSDAPPVAVTRPRKHYEEVIQRVDITEQVYYPSQRKSCEETTPYYAHIGVKAEGDTYTLFANWDTFLGEYFLTAGNARHKLVSGTVRDSGHERLIDSFRNYAPLLYKVLTDPQSPVKPMEAFPVGDHKLNVMAIRDVANPLSARDTLIQTCVDICREVNATSHLAIWRRYLRTVWLHQ